MRPSCLRVGGSSEEKSTRDTPDVARQRFGGRSRIILVVDVGMIILDRFDVHWRAYLMVRLI